MDPDNDEPVNPGPEEVRAITEIGAERIIALLGERPPTPREKDRVSVQIGSALLLYAEDFGQEAANHLDSYCRYQADRDRRRER